MLPIQIDLFCAFVVYLLLMMVYNQLQSSAIHTIASRLLSVFLSYLFLFFLADYLLINVLVILKIFDDPYNILTFIGAVFLNGFLVWAIRKGAEKFQLTEMLNYIRTSLVFGNYFRLRDVDTQERIGTHRMKTIYEEVHGKPFSEEILATPFDQQVTKFKKVSLEELKEKPKRLPPEYREEIVQLKAMQVTDVSVSFRFQLMDAGFHPMLRLMEHFVIDPNTLTLSFDITYPVEKKISAAAPAEQDRMAEKVYEALHIIIGQDWFSLYAPYIGSISVLCRKKDFNDEMHEVVIPIMSLTVSLEKLRLRANRITTISEIRSIAVINFF